VWLVDPARRSARAAGSLRQRAHDASGALLDGAAVVFGGGAATGLSAVQAWTVTGTRIVGALPTARSDSACAVVAGTAYVVGGFDGRALTRDVLATRDGHRFRVVGRLPIGVRYPAVAAIGTDIYVVGGALATTEGTAAGAQTAAVQRIDTATGRVAVVGRLSRPLAHATAFALDGRLLVVGGRHGAAATSAVSEIDVRTGHDSRVGSLPVALSDAGVAVTGGTAWVVGGETTGPSAPVATVYALRVAS
jgi:N-acetylneuraminic acid mutarotase